MHVYEVRPRKAKCGVDLIFDALPVGRLWYGKPDNAIGYAMHSSRSHDAVIHVYDAAGNHIGVGQVSLVHIPRTIMSWVGLESYNGGGGSSITAANSGQFHSVLHRLQLRGRDPGAQRRHDQSSQW
jgi:hypothetical protein